MKRVLEKHSMVLTQTDFALSRGRSTGFTLIELMIVVAIIAIILTLALPVYTDYTIRTKVGEALNIATATKTAIAATCVKEPAIPLVTESNTGYQFASATKYVADITLSGPCTQPVITIQTRNTGAVPDPVVTLTGALGEGRMQYTCATSGFFQQVPAECRNALQ